ncbi:SAM-dependent methyltransferase [Psychromonas sp. CNPT3]|uniref:class I SAM-dependent methyltransferase n=1 Tax=Psychromonas sp. CNPT3 TaxID=314282 RepID=UPI00006E9D10|nr:class I SAM-dependent methyltransferase [Psychromonas sp. CNPT3]AGH81173.1 SAM-dependent methyltransferase [Psychromonas sp. CNPT3]
MQPQEIASQLRCPSGAEATDVAKKMNISNYSLNKKCIGLLQLKASDSVLEIGPGNGTFVADIINVAKDITYMGVDWSAEMVVEARSINEHLINIGIVQFQQGNSQQLAFESHIFDKVFTAHTIYFWDDPSEHLAEIRRVLKPSGLLCIAFGNCKFMKDLAFVEYGFELYDPLKAIKLLHSSGFSIIETYQHKERGRSNAGDIVDKVIDILVCKA